MHNSKAPKPMILVWTDISVDQLNKLEGLTDAESINEFFIKIFQFEPNTKRTKILCDLFYYALNFARANKFNYEQISTFLSIIKRVHEMCISTPFSNMDETYQYFKALVLKHSLFRPPHNLRIFTPDITKSITDYVVDTYFRHYKMYKYIFTPTIDFSLKFTYEGMTRQIPHITEENEEGETHKTEDIQHKGEDNQEKQNQKLEEHHENSQLDEVRKLIQSYVKEEIEKLQTPSIKAPETPHLQVEKQRPVKSSSTKSSKPRTPK